MGLAVAHPDAVKKLVFVGGLLGAKDYKQGVSASMKGVTGKSLEQDIPELVRQIKSLMPEPDRFDEVVQGLKTTWFTQPH